MIELPVYEIKNGIEYNTTESTMLYETKNTYRCMDSLTETIHTQLWIGKNGNFFYVKQKTVNQFQIEIETLTRNPWYKFWLEKNSITTHTYGETNTTECKEIVMPTTRKNAQDWLENQGKKSYPVLKKYFTIQKA